MALLQTIMVERKGLRHEVVQQEAAERWIAQQKVMLKPKPINVGPILIFTSTDEDAEDTEDAEDAFYNYPEGERGVDFVGDERDNDEYSFI